LSPMTRTGIINNIIMEPENSGGIQCGQWAVISLRTKKTLSITGNICRFFFWISGSSGASKSIILNHVRRCSKFSTTWALCLSRFTGFLSVNPVSISGLSGCVSIYTGPYIYTARHTVSISVPCLFNGIPLLSFFPRYSR
jgi:hypothetical protein